MPRHSSTADAVDPRIARTREAVLAAATELLATEGIGRLTIDAIANRSGVARSTVYRNWPERADLLAAAFESVAQIQCPLVALGCAGDHLVGDSCAAPPPQTVEEFRRVVDEHAHRVVAMQNSTLGGAMASIVAEASHDEAIAKALYRYGRARRTALASAADHVIAAVGAEPLVEPVQAVERWVSPFFYRHLVSGESIDEQLVDRQTRMLLLDLGLVPPHDRRLD